MFRGDQAITSKFDNRKQKCCTDRGVLMNQSLCLSVWTIKTRPVLLTSNLEKSKSKFKVSWVVTQSSMRYSGSRINIRWLISSDHAAPGALEFSGDNKSDSTSIFMSHSHLHNLHTTLSEICILFQTNRHTVILSAKSCVCDGKLLSCQNLNLVALSARLSQCALSYEAGKRVCLFCVFVCVYIYVCVPEGECIQVGPCDANMNMSTHCQIYED